MASKTALVKSESKNIAMKVIQQISSCKHFNGSNLMVLIGDYTQCPKVKKEAYNQCRRALKILGY